MTSVRVALLIAISGITLMSSGITGRALGAEGDARAACVASYDSAQKHRLDGKLLDAQKALRMCADPACPPIVQNDCVVWLRELEATLPTVIFAARESSGDDITDVVVSVDGIKVLPELTGKGTAIDPGVHVVRFVRGTEVVEQKLVVAEGEKARVVRVTFAHTKKAAAPAVDPPAAETRRRIPLASYVLGGVGVVALGVGGSLWYSGRSELADHRDDCAPYCNQDDVDATRRKLRYGDLAVSLGVLSIGAAVLVHYLQPTEAPRAASVGINVVRGGAILGFVTAF